MPRKRRGKVAYTDPAPAYLNGTRRFLSLYSENMTEIDKLFEVVKEHLEKRIKPKSRYWDKPLRRKGDSDLRGYRAVRLGKGKLHGTKHNWRLVYRYGKANNLVLMALIERDKLYSIHKKIHAQDIYRVLVANAIGV